MVKISFPLSYPVYGPPETSISQIWRQVRNLAPEDIGPRFAVVIDPETLEPRKVGRKAAALDPLASLQKSRVI